MTNKFTMREMIEKTIAVYQGLYDTALAEEQAEADALAVRRIKRNLKKTYKPAFGAAVKHVEPIPKRPKVKLIKEKASKAESPEIEDEIKVEETTKVDIKSEAPDADQKS